MYFMSLNLCSINLYAMKKIYFLLFLFSVSLSSKAGFDLLFCTNADSLGHCKGQGQTFTWQGDKTDLELIVMNNETLGTKKLKFMLFAMINDREGKLYADLSLNVVSSALFAVKKIHFFKPGYYKIDVLDENDKRLTTSFVTIMDRVE